jgi:hypothetical protein
MTDRPVLELQDVVPASTARTSRQPPAVTGTPAPVNEWRDWTGRTRVTSFRLPIELLDELAEQAARTGIAAGHLALGHLVAGLDHGDDDAVAQADRAIRALTAGKRNARRNAHP